MCLGSWNIIISIHVVWSYAKFFFLNLQYILIRKCGGNCIICEHVFGNQKWIHGFAFMEHALFDWEFVGIPKCTFLYWMRSMVHNLFKWCGQPDRFFFFSIQWCSIALFNRIFHSASYNALSLLSCVNSLWFEEIVVLCLNSSSLQPHGWGQWAPSSFQLCDGLLSQLERLLFMITTWSSFFRWSVSLGLRRLWCCRGQDGGSMFIAYVYLNSSFLSD